VLTEPGAGALAEAVADWLVDARLAVSDGTQQAAAALTQPPQVDGTRVALTAEFGEAEANFEWRIVRILRGETVVDEENVDLGRKAGGVMTHTATIDVAPA
jgi:hypothetical protein